MPAQRIAENLAFINWTILAALGLGAFASVVLARLATDATRGYLAFTAACAASFGLLAYLSDGALPTGVGGTAAVPIDPAFDGARRACLLTFGVLAIAYTLVLARRGRAAWLGIAGVVAGTGAFVFGALGWGGGFPILVALLGQSLLLAAATGGVFASMILGHWYLVTPKLPEGPLVLFARLLLGVVALQLVFFAISVALGGGSGGAPFAPLTGPWALFVWLRLLVGLIFPLIISWAAIQTARTRSMESATGLLYINVGTIASATIVASGLYFGAGLLV
ncbi:MAG: hypothetical protein M3P84_08990 [Chloroflexota bacterium]|nr:hypothetical protein [Chloroflexota bacterium]